MNVGQTEGSQIIQLFGRGVRLKGYGSSLKRSGNAQLPDEIERPKHIGVLETLSIFGIRADYMAQFRDFLEEEGLPVNDDRIEFMLPIIKNLGTQKLKMFRLKNTINGISTEFGDAFRRLGPIPTLSKPDPAKEEATAYLQKNQVVLNWYPKTQAMKSGGVAGGDVEAAPNQAHLNTRHIAFDVLRTERRQLLARGAVACRFVELSVDTPRSRPKPRDPASPTPSSSARTCRPPTAARRTLTLFSAMGVIHLFVEFDHHHRFDDGQKFSRDGGRRAEGLAKGQRRRHVPADHRARQHTQLAAEAADQVPDLPTLLSFRTVQPRRAVRAGLRAGLAVSLAPAEGPFAESAEAFFSCSSSRPLET